MERAVRPVVCLGVRSRSRAGGAPGEQRGGAGNEQRRHRSEHSDNAPVADHAKGHADSPLSWWPVPAGRVWPVGREPSEQWGGAVLPPGVGTMNNLSCGRRRRPGCGRRQRRPGPPAPRPPLPPAVQNGDSRPPAPRFPHISASRGGRVNLGEPTLVVTASQCADRRDGAWSENVKIPNVSRAPFAESHSERDGGVARLCGPHNPAPFMRQRPQALT